MLISTVVINIYLCNQCVRLFHVGCVHIIIFGVGVINGEVMRATLAAFNISTHTHHSTSQSRGLVGSSHTSSNLIDVLCLIGRTSIIVQVLCLLCFLFLFIWFHWSWFNMLFTGSLR